MQDLDNHMDELFRKSAEDYPLKIQAGNFDTVLPFIPNSTTVTTHPANKKSQPLRSLRLILAMSVLLVAVTIVWETTNTSSRSISKSSTLKKGSKENILSSARINSRETQNNNNFIANNLPSTTIQKIDLTKRKSTPVKKPAKLNTNENVSRKPLKENLNYSALKEKEHFVPVDDFVTPEPLTIDNSLIREKILIEKPASYNFEDGLPDASTIRNIRNQPKFAPYLYYGGLVGVELNSVSLQGTNRTTFNGGLAIGLQIKRRLSLETAVILSQKKYASDGKYFKPKTGSMPSSMVIRSLTSSINVVEFPISFKYDFSKKLTGLYGKLGFSSFILTKENNTYNALVAGQEQRINSQYQTNHTYLASSVRLAGGFQKQVAKNLKLRFEPYIQIPTKGMGVGSMSVTSAGIQLYMSNR